MKMFAAAIADVPQLPLSDIMRHVLEAQGLSFCFDGRGGS